MTGEKSNFFPYFAVISVNFLAFSAGGALSWTSPSLPKLTSPDPEINPLGAPITMFEESCIASLMAGGCVVGCLISGIVAESLGRKKTLIIFAVPMFSCYVLTAFATRVSFFYVARIILGIGVGSVFAVLPSYVSEISEDSNRGILGGIMGVATALGHLFNYTVGPFVSVRVFSLLHLVPLILFYLLFLPFIPESPYYFLSIGNNGQAMECLKKLRNETDSDVEKELLHMKEQVKESASNKAELKDIFKSKALIKGLIVCCGLMFFQQFQGIAPVLSYLQTIFDASGNIIPASIAPIPVGIVQMISNIVAMVLVDKLGRKPLLILSSSGVFVSLLSLGIYFFLKTNNYNLDQITWLPICSLIIFIVFFNIGYASIPWIISGEIFSSNVKSLGSSICSCFCLTATFIITMTFPYMAVALDMSGTFWLFSAASLSSIIFIVLLVPETKGKSPLEIQHMLEGEKARELLLE
ncbi:hypothetical protein JTB14_035078 [Gonioctena quinquepunctata]|nr:hypothetical protein JTB14_035078 [Gonioctena quinquepunctata]